MAAVKCFRQLLLPVFELFLIVLSKLRGAAVWLATPNQSVLKHLHSTKLMTVVYRRSVSEKERR